MPRPARPARRTARVRGAALAVLLLVGTAACSLSGDDQDAADALAEAIGNEDATDSVRDRAECLTGKWVGEVGRPALVDEGLLSGEENEARPSAVRRVLAGEQPVARDVAEGYADAWLACADYDLIALDEEERLPEASAEDLDEYADCLKEIDDDRWRAGLVARLTGEDVAGADALAGDLDACREDLAQRAAG